MATIQLTESAKVDSMKLKDREGWFEVGLEETEISSYTASHYIASPKLRIGFTEADRNALMELPQREVSMLAMALKCEEDIEQIVSILLPKKPARKSSTKKTTKKKTE